MDGVDFEKLLLDRLSSLVAWFDECQEYVDSVIVFEGPGVKGGKRKRQPKKNKK